MGFAPSLLQNLLQARRQQISHDTWPGQLAGQARRLGYKCAGRRGHQLGSLQSSQRVPAAVLVVFEDIRLEPNSMTGIAIPGSCPSPLCPAHAKSNCIQLHVPIDTGCLSAASRLQVEASLACYRQASCSQSILLTAASRV